MTHYTIDAIARITGISAFTLRNWEKRHGFLNPRRLDNGFRSYSDEDVKTLQKVAVLLRHGARIGDLAESLRKGRPLPDLVEPGIPPEAEAHVRDLTESLRAFDPDLCDRLHEELTARFSPQQMLEMVYAPLIAQAARDKLSGRATTAQQHFTGAFIRLKLAAAVNAIPSGASATKATRKVICASTAGESEINALLLLTAHLKFRGWTPYYLSCNIPVEAALSAAQAIRPEAVFLSVAQRHEIRDSLELLSRFECPVFLGGFAALTYDAEESLPAHLHLVKHLGDQASDLAQELDHSALG